MGLLLSIKDFSEICKVKQGALRYWDEIGLIIPAFRDEYNGYRYYSPDQMMTVSLLKILSSLELPLSNISDIIRDCAPGNILALFRQGDDQLAAQIEELRARQDMLRSYAALMQEIQATRPGRIVKRALSARPMRLSPIENRGSHSAGLKQAHRQIRENGGGSYLLGYAHSDFFTLLEQPNRPSRLVSYDPRGTGQRPAGTYLLGAANCGYGEMGGLPRRMLEYASRNGLEPCGPAYSTYIRNAACAAGQGQYLLQVTVGVKQTANGV